MDEGMNHTTSGPHCAPSPRTTDNDTHGPWSTGSPISLPVENGRTTEQPAKGELQIGGTSSQGSRIHIPKRELEMAKFPSRTDPPARPSGNDSDKPPTNAAGTCK